jgi:hypothetical protein
MGAVGIETKMILVPPPSRTASDCVLRLSNRGWVKAQNYLALDEPQAGGIGQEFSGAIRGGPIIEERP